MDILNYLNEEWNTLIDAPLLSVVLIVIGFILARFFYKHLYRERISLLEKTADINEITELKKELKAKNKKIKELNELNETNFKKIIKDLTKEKEST